MFVRQSKYDAMELRAAQATRELSRLTEKWNELVGKINAKGGQPFLDGPARPATAKAAPPQFEQPEIRKLITLCHPDKHGGSKVAEEITVKLLQLRK